MDDNVNTEVCTVSENRVRRYLERHLRAVVPGSSLPSVRQVMKGCRVGPATVTKVIEQLKNQNIIEVCTRRGIFKPKADRPEQSEFSNVDFIYFSGSPDKIQPSSFADELFRALTEQLTARNITIRLHEIPRNTTFKEMQRFILNSQCSICILDNLFRDDILDVFEENSIPCVILFPSGPDVLPGSIIIDPDELVHIQLSHLMSLGHRKIGYLHNAEPMKFHRDLVFRREAYYRQIAEHGLPLRRNWVQFGGYDAKSIASATNSLLEGDDRPTAAIVSDRHLSIVYQVLAEHGLSVPRDFSVVGTDDIPMARLVHPAATTVKVSRQAAAELVIKMLDNIYIGQSPKSPAMVPLELIVRESTAPVRQA